MPCVCVNGGGGCSVANTTVQEYLTGFGVPYIPNDPLPYQPVLAKFKPAGIGSFATFYQNLGEACLRARALLFCNTRPGDCGAIQGSGGISGEQIAGVVGGTGISVASALTAPLAAAAGLSAVAGVATAGAGLVLTAVLQIFQNHAAAEAQQSNVLCQLIPQFNQLVQKVDQAVFTGQATPEQAIITLQQAAQQFANADSHLTKSCNAFCAFNAIAAAFSEISKYIYGIEPIPGQISSSMAPTGIGTSGEIPQSFAGIPGSIPTPSPSIFNPISPVIPSSVGNMPTWAIAAIILVVVLLIVNRG
jgi:hypothetical protein